jgi:hypothetical protein
MLLTGIVAASGGARVPGLIAPPLTKTCYAVAESNSYLGSGSG